MSVIKEIDLAKMMRPDLLELEEYIPIEPLEKLSERLYEELRVLRQELVETQATNRLCLRRIYQLEGFIHKQPGIESPAMDGWPPAG